jgi:hypothetical protein
VSYEKCKKEVFLGSVDHACPYYLLDLLAICCFELAETPNISWLEPGKMGEEAYIG